MVLPTRTVSEFCSLFSFLISNFTKGGHMFLLLFLNPNFTIHEWKQLHYKLTHVLAKWFNMTLFAAIDKWNSICKKKVCQYIGIHIEMIHNKLFSRLSWLLLVCQRLSVKFKKIKACSILFSRLSFFLEKASNPFLLGKCWNDYRLSSFEPDKWP